MDAQRYPEREREEDGEGEGEGVGEGEEECGEEEGDVFSRF
jgi:hypothetical protein